MVQNPAPQFVLETPLRSIVILTYQFLLLQKEVLGFVQHAHLRNAVSRAGELAGVQAFQLDHRVAVVPAVISQPHSSASFGFSSSASACALHTPPSSSIVSKTNRLDINY
jgi:hypothetical protein